MIEADPTILERINALDKTDLQKKALERQKTNHRLVNFYIMLVEIYIKTGVIKDVDMTAYKMYQQSIFVSLKKRGFGISDPKRAKHIAELTRTMAVEYAVRLALMSELSFDDRVDEETFELVRFFDKPYDFVCNIEKLLVATRGMTVYVNTLCRSLFDNPVRSKLILAAKKLAVGHIMEMFDDECFTDEILEGNKARSRRKKQAAAAAAGAEEKGRKRGAEKAGVFSDTHKKNGRREKKMNAIFMMKKTANDETVNANYVEIRGEGVSLAEVCRKLRNTAGGSISENNVEKVLGDMSRELMKVDLFELDPSTMTIRNTGIKQEIAPVKIVRNTKALDPNGLFGNGRRVFFATHLLINHHTFDEAMVASIKELGCNITVPGNCIVNIEVAKRTFRPPKSDKAADVDTNGVLEVVRIDRRPGVNKVFKSPTSTRLECTEPIS